MDDDEIALLCFDQRHNIVVRHLCSLNVSLALPGLFHLSHGGTGKTKASFQWFRSKRSLLIRLLLQ